MPSYSMARRSLGVLAAVCERHPIEVSRKRVAVQSNLPIRLSMVVVLLASQLSVEPARAAQPAAVATARTEAVRAGPEIGRTDLLEQLAAESNLLRLKDILDVRAEHYVSARAIQLQISSRIRAGVDRSVNLDLAEAEQLQAQIDWQIARRSLDALATVYCERHGRFAALDLRFDQLLSAGSPASFDAVVAASADADAGALWLAWQRSQRAVELVGLHDKRVLALEKAGNAYQLQFENSIGLRAMTDFSLAVRALAAARVNQADARAELVNARIDLLSMRGDFNPAGFRKDFAPREPGRGCGSDDEVSLAELDRRAQERVAKLQLPGGSAVPAITRLPAVPPLPPPIPRRRR